MANETPITISGNLTADPELKFTPAGAALCRFTVASTPRRYDKDTGKWVDGEALFLTCTAWRTAAENVAESLTKGMRVVVTGRLRQHHWDDPETGQHRSMFGLDVDDVGASLLFATASVRRASRGTTTAGDDAWATATGQRPAAAGATNETDPAYSTEPPF
ncbi:single stranded DNA-binding protein [Frankia sp. CpI1-P]|uniref:single-stranded DNA-binding protein n=1 Tax=Frankia sp. CpI1-P TaxID=1502734 RepID=UPI000701B831|nr:single-stranded DNA-binding protein [Frankia sp. CpI1-P]KQM06206.1 single stranded DNA-binding protein [Frankia sp. CpI1-P]